MNTDAMLETTIARLMRDLWITRDVAIDTLRAALYRLQQAEPDSTQHAIDSWLSGQLAGLAW